MAMPLLVPWIGRAALAAIKYLFGRGVVNLITTASFAAVWPALLFIINRLWHRLVLFLLGGAGLYAGAEVGLLPWLAEQAFEFFMYLSFWFMDASLGFLSGLAADTWGSTLFPTPQELFARIPDQVLTWIRATGLFRAAGFILGVLLWRWVFRLALSVLARARPA